MELLQRPSWNSFSRRNVSPGPRRLTCSVCLNLRLDEDRNLSEHDRGYVKISLFHLTESAALADCRYCYLVYNGVMSSGLALDLGECPIITVFARYDAPLYVSWHDSLCGRVTIELFTPFGMRRRSHSKMLWTDIWKGLQNHIMSWGLLAISALLQTQKPYLRWLRIGSGNVNVRTRNVGLLQTLHFLGE